MDFVGSHPNMKYIYVGKAKNLIPFVRNKLFQYYLHFVRLGFNSSYRSVCSGDIIQYKYQQSIRQRYRSQLKRKAKETTSVTLWDYYILHDMHTEKTIIGKFNKRIFKPKKKPIINVDGYKPMNQQLAKTLNQHVLNIIEI